MTKYTINKKDPSSFYKTSYSYSKFRTFKDCPYKYKIKYYFGIDEEENLSFTIGRIYHGILKDFFVRAEQDYTWSELKRIIDSVFNRKKHSFELRYLRDEILNKAYFDFKRFYDHFVSGKKPQVIMEKNFSFNIGDEIVKGRIDQINLVDDERVELIDFKSGTKNISKIELEKEIQLRLYRTAVDLCSELDFIKGKKIDLKYIYIGDDKSREPWLLLPGDIYDSGDFIVYIRKIIEDIKNEHFPAEPENKFECQLCSYKLLCPNKKA